VRDEKGAMIMTRYANIEKSRFWHGEYVGYDAQGERYRIARDGPRKDRGSWWVYPQTPRAIPCFYASTLALVSLRLERRVSISAIGATGHERFKLTEESK
jgi:hypothetical protein